MERDKIKSSFVHICEGIAHLCPLPAPPAARFDLESVKSRKAGNEASNKINRLPKKGVSKERDRERETAGEREREKRVGWGRRLGISAYAELYAEIAYGW